ncbi:Vacuolar membrane protein [Golovinomyces cichoracearum]|uniref:Vacuolar membrane protein n=1 Tax=Golovinomyces cichoracearum TaxID=62708 RepID=A0A420ITJ7_9PEZI|nr:Vacuolar membrane protein [Golovinomyces cichoracearum]
MLPSLGVELLSFDSTSIGLVATPTNILPSITSSVSLSDTATGTYSSRPNDLPLSNGECRLLGPFAIVVQGALGFLALTALVYKRWRERPQRPVNIWFFDVSKQVVGSFLVHLANLAMSMLSSGNLSLRVDPASVETKLNKRIRENHEIYHPNPCSFYLLNLAIDTTIGIPILFLFLRVFTSLLLHTSFGNPPESIESGNYGTPPSSSRWLKQSLIYFLGLLAMKICVLLIFIIFPWISRVGDWALKWTEGNEAVQITFVMLVFPLIMNATQYYIIDGFIKDKNLNDHEQTLQADHNEEQLYSELIDDDTNDSLSSEDEDEDVELETKKKRLVRLQLSEGVS